MSRKNTQNKQVNFEALHSSFESYAHLSQDADSIIPAVDSVIVYEAKRNRRVLMQFTEEKVLQSDYRLRAQAVAFNHNNYSEYCNSWSGFVLGFRSRAKKGLPYSQVGEPGMSPILGSVYIKQNRVAFDDQWLPEIGSEIRLFAPAIIDALPTTIYQPPRKLLTSLLSR